MSLRVSIKVNICPYLLAPRDLYLLKQIQQGYSVILYELRAMELEIYPPLLPQRRICSLPFKRNSLHSPYLSSLKGRESDPVKIRLHYQNLEESKLSFERLRCQSRHKQFAFEVWYLSHCKTHVCDVFYVIFPVPHKSACFVILLQHFAVLLIITILSHSEVDIFGAGEHRAQIFQILKKVGVKWPGL